MPGLRTSSALELHVPIHRDQGEALHVQLERGIREAVRSGRLPPLTVLPSSRALAVQLDVARGVVVEAYEQLAAEGYLASRPGGATRVAAAPTATSPPAAAPSVERFEIDFRPGRPDLGHFPRAAWLRSIRRALNEAPNERFGYLDGRGVPELRSTLAAYLNRVRGTDADPERVLIVTGFAQALRLIGSVLVARGVRRIALENPSYDDAQRTMREAGLDVVGVPVDDAGMRVELLERARVGAVLVTPAHQFPTGAVLSADRRAALVAWASRRGFVIEDDYDAEFRYDREPIGALQGLAPDRVIYAGSASKVLAPGLRLGWLVLPSSLLDSMAAVKKAADLGSPALDQLAFADYLARGELDRHLRRMRPIYRRRRDALRASLTRHLPDLRPVGASAGLHVLAWLPDGMEEGSAVRSAAGAGIGIYGLRPSWVGRPGQGGLIFGYGLLEADAIDGGVRRLAAALRPSPRGGPDPKRFTGSLSGRSRRPMTGNPSDRPPGPRSGAGGEASRASGRTAFRRR